MIAPIPFGDANRLAEDDRKALSYALDPCCPVMSGSDAVGTKHFTAP